MTIPVATVAEVKLTEIPGSVTTTLTMDTPLVASDVVVVILSKPSSGTVTVVGPGSSGTLTATFDKQVYVGMPRVRMYQCKGQTGTCAVQFTASIGLANACAEVYILRGLYGDMLMTFSAESTWPDPTPTSPVPEAIGGAVAGCGPGQVAIYAGHFSAGTITLPASPTNPATGWTVDRLEGNNRHSSMHRVIDSDTDVSAYGTASLTGASAGVLFIFGRKEGPTPTGAVSILKSAVVSLPTSGNAVITTPVLQLGDLVVVYTSRGTNGFITMSGLGGPWQQLMPELTTQAVRQSIYYLVPAIDGAAGTITVSQNSGAYVGWTFCYVLRGLSNPYAHVEQHSVWDGNNTPANTAETVTGLPVGENQVAILSAGNSAGTVTFPEAPVPTGKYATDAFLTTDRQMYAASFIGTVSETAGGGLKSTASSFMGAILVIYGEGYSVTPPELPAAVIDIDELVVLFRDDEAFIGP